MRASDNGSAGTAAFGAAVLALLLLAGLTLLGPPPRLHDLPEWAYQGRLLLERLSGSAAVAGFVPAPYPVPNSFMTLAGALLGTLMGVVPAVRLLLAMYLLAWIPVTRRLLDRFGRPGDHAAATVILVTAGLSTQFWNGFLNYQAGLLLFAAWAGSGRRAPLATCLYGLAIFFCHASVFACFILAVLLLQGRRHLPALLPSLALTAWYAIGRLLADQAGPRPDAELAGLTETILYKGYTFVRLGPFHNFIMPDGRSLIENLPLLYWGGFAANLAFAALTALLLLAVLPKALPGRDRPDRTDRRLALLSLAGLAAFVLLPYNLLGLFNPGERLLLPAVLLALLLPAPARLLRPLAGLAAAFALASALMYAGVAMAPATPATPDSSAEAAAAAGPEERASVRAFNDRLYARTGQRYFNSRPLAYANRYDWMDRGVFPELGFDTGMFVRGPNR